MTPPPPPPFAAYLPPAAAAATSHLLTCHSCRTQLTSSSNIISKTFRGRHGRAYLLSATSLDPAAATLAPPQQRALASGVHTVQDFACAVCGAPLGWRYVDAADETQRYKRGKWVLELAGVGRAGGEGDGREVLRREVEQVLAAEDVDLDDEGERVRLFRGY